MENEQNNLYFQRQDSEPKGQSENEQSHYTSLPSDGPVSQSEAQGKSNLQNTDREEDQEEISGDLAGNASGNDDADDQ